MRPGGILLGHSARRMIVLGTKTGVVAVPMFPPDAKEKLNLVLDQRDAELLLMLAVNFAARESAKDGDLIEALKELHRVRHLEVGMLQCDEHPYFSDADLEEINEDSDIRLAHILQACQQFVLPWQERRRLSRLATPPKSNNPTTEGR